ncbi:hypothetical protein TELCIR_21165 [Teladorsagia circumcincta]|uniref:Uncharacterized protein n=1 Tax=Teladorsagia circumcincta TaxID=45464 RepID=A0A2G9THI4_TELCI|nr:hypothetical protein TELCIR_21165 [Teladorsagia circumcincta]
MLLALAALSIILVSVGAKECQCDSGLDDDCAIFMWGYFRATYRNMTWNDLMSKHADRRLQRGSVPPVEGYHPIFFSRSFDLGDSSPMEQKLHLTLYRDQLPKENVSHLHMVGQSSQCIHGFHMRGRVMLNYGLTAGKKFSGKMALYATAQALHTVHDDRQFGKACIANC